MVDPIYKNCIQYVCTVYIYIYIPRAQRTSSIFEGQPSKRRPKLQSKHGHLASILAGPGWWCLAASQKLRLKSNDFPKDPGKSKRYLKPPPIKPNSKKNKIIVLFNLWEQNCWPSWKPCNELFFFFSLRFFTNKGGNNSSHFVWDQRFTKYSV